MYKKIKEICIIQLAVILFSLTGVFSKKAASFKMFSVDYLFYYGIAMFVMFLYAIIWQQLLKKYPLNIAYANKGTLPLITMVWGVTLFNETITLPMFIGAIVVILGIGLVVSDGE